jgi:hypothetical protein
MFRKSMLDTDADALNDKTRPTRSQGVLDLAVGWRTIRNRAERGHDHIDSELQHRELLMRLPRSSWYLFIGNASLSSKK